jgi:hypothetical protein
VPSGAVKARSPAAEKVEERSKRKLLPFASAMVG